MAMILYRKVEGCDSSNPIKILSQISPTSVKVFAVYMRERAKAKPSGQDLVVYYNIQECGGWGPAGLECL